MKRIIVFATTVPMLMGQVFAQDIYMVRKGNTLSELVKRHFPHHRLYGPQGKLAEILKLNPQITNPNLIFPNQELYLTPIVATESTAREIFPVIEAETLLPPVSEEVVTSQEVGKSSEWNISGLYGMKYLSVSQSGALGKADVGVMFFNDLKVNSEFIFEDYSWGFQIDTYRFKYEAMGAGDAKQMHALKLFGSYQWFLAGINLEQSPLFRNNNSSVEMTKMTLMNLSLGAKKDYKLQTSKPTVLKLKGWLNYPFSSSSDDSDIKLDSVGGLGLIGQIELNRQIVSKVNYSLHVSWMSELALKKSSVDVEWGTAKGDVKSTVSDVSTSLGLLLKF